MKTQHTKGPWEINETWGTIEGSKGEEIAAIHPAQAGDTRRVNRAVAQANANLIAAAPEMYALLKELMDNGHIDTTDERLKAIKKTIARAEGRVK